MKRSDFIKSLGIVPALFLLPKLLPAVLGATKKDEPLYACGFWGNDKSLTIGTHLGGDEQFFITYRKLHDKIMIPSYENWKKHFLPNKKAFAYPRNYKEAARNDWLTRELVARQREGMKRFPFREGFGTTEENTRHAKEYFARLAEWCEMMVKRFKSMA